MSHSMKQIVTNSDVEQNLDIYQLEGPQLENMVSIEVPNCSAKQKSIRMGIGNLYKNGETIGKTNKQQQWLDLIDEIVTFHLALKNWKFHRCYEELSFIYTSLTWIMSFLLV